MEIWEIGDFYGTDVQKAKNHLLQVIDIYRDKKVIYFDGWNGFGAVPVLRSIAQFHKGKRSIAHESHSAGLCFDRIIDIDCSAWENKRKMQRKIAEELQLDHATMEMFDKQDEEDDFNGVDHSSRDVIPSVAAVIDKSLRDTNYIMIFLNGSGDEIDPNIFGLFFAKDNNNVMIWTFKTRFLTIHGSPDEIASKLRYTHLFLYDKINRLSSSKLSELLHNVATTIVARHTSVQGIDRTMVIDCCLYQLLLHYSFHSTTKFGWMTHGSNYWMCDGITNRGNTSIEIDNKFLEEISWKSDGIWLDKLLEEFMKDPKAPFFIANDHIVPEEKLYQTKLCRWVSITSKILAVSEKDMQTVLGGASSLFLAFERSDKSSDPPDLPNGLFKHCSNLAVLVLSLCTFSFVSPPFLECQTIKFLGLEHCIDMTASKAKYSTNWEHLHSLWVLDIRYTEWEEILTEEKIKIMAHLRELNIEGFKCWQHTSQFENRLPYLERLRMTKPVHRTMTIPVDTRDSFVDKKRLKLLDFSGNEDMKNLPTSITNAGSLEVLILDGCDELENVVLSSEFHPSLRSFSFDGYGPAFHWTSMVDLPPESSRPKLPSDANKRDIKTLKISIQGCKQLENLFLRGLPNLVELDLSGSTIKALDFDTMVVDVPNLKQLFLLGCEHLRAIRWGSKYSMGQSKLELLCIDTLPGWSIGCTRPSLVKHTSFRLQVLAVIGDIRLCRSLSFLIAHSEDVYFNICITSSTVCDSFLEQEATSTEMIGPKDQRNLVLAGEYGDVFNMIGDVPSLMEAFQQPLTLQSDHHIEIAGGSPIINSETEAAASYSIAFLMQQYTESLHVHDSSTISSLPRRRYWYRLRWCRVVRCPKLDTIFPRGSSDVFNKLEIIWASDLPMARCIWSKGPKTYFSFSNLQHLLLESCPRLQFVLPVWVYSFPNLRSIHIIHCGDLEHVFVLNEEYPPEIPIHGVSFPKLTTIFLHDLPKLQQISEFKMLAPSLETIRFRGCFGLRRVPSLKGYRLDVKKPAIEIEKDVWDALEWDGLHVYHHPSLFELRVRSRYYKRAHLKSTVLRFVNPERRLLLARSPISPTDAATY
ncbi:hypothetical protein ACP4OV_011904 [Aristida adscensionis]